MLLRFVFEPKGRKPMEWTVCPRGEKLGGERLASIPSLQKRVLPLALLYDDGSRACSTFFKALSTLRRHIAGEGHYFAPILDELDVPSCRTALSLVMPAPVGSGEALYEHTASFAPEGPVQEKLTLSTRSTCRELYFRTPEGVRTGADTHAARQFHKYVRAHLFVSMGDVCRGERKLVQLRQILSRRRQGVTIVKDFDEGITPAAAARLLNDFLRGCNAVTRGQLVVGVSSPDLMSMVRDLRRDELNFFMGGDVTNGVDMPNLPKYGRTMKHIRERYMDACASFADAVLGENVSKGECGNA